MNQMIGTEAGLGVQTEGTMVRLPNQFLQTACQTFPFPVLFFFISIDRLDKAPLISEAHIYLLRVQFPVSLFDGLGEYTFTLVFQKPSACSTEPARTLGPVDPMTLPETEAAHNTNCVRDAECTRASRHLLLPPYHCLRLHIWWRPRRLLARCDASLLSSQASPGPVPPRPDVIAVMNCNRNVCIALLSHMRDSRSVWQEVVEVVPHHGLGARGLV